MQRQPSKQQIGTPDQFGEAGVTPQAVMSHDHSFTLQAVMELQKSTGELTAAVSLMRDSLSAQDQKLDRLIDKQEQRLGEVEATLNSVTTKLYAAGVVLVAVLAIGGFMVDKAWDIMADKVTVSLEQAKPKVEAGSIKVKPE